MPPWEPSPKQLAYLWALRDALIPVTGDNITSDTGMAKKIKVSRTIIWQWKQDPEFTAWKGRMMSGANDDEFDLVVAKQTQLAIRGSVRSAEFLARLRSVGQRGGGFNEGGDAVDQSVTNYTVISLVPRPPALPEKAVGGGQA